MGDALAYRVRAREAVPHRSAAIDPAATAAALSATGMGCGLPTASAASGWPRYRALLDAARGIVALGSDEMVFGNTIGLMEALDAWVFNVALADRRSNADPEVRQRPGARSRARSRAAASATRCSIARCSSSARRVRVRRCCSRRWRGRRACSRSATKVTS